MNTEFFYGNGTSNIFDEQVQEASGYFDDKSFPLTGLTDLRKYIKNQDIQVEARSSADTEMKEAELKKERVLQYNIYTLEDCERWFYFLKEKLIKPTQAALAALAANINYGTARKWKKTYKGRP
ncbi:hypothetical protein INT47_009256 [Mucor saturninus]|uniref:Uncharacterized protein n=1 Tax=Mucor saturninus TaxID=64648 RepID=A0A8H7QX66_9FUNG|nr:hypothetical protein INT47_009256 [Mucor saturninus]